MLGQQSGSLDPLAESLLPGLSILGDFDRFELEPWVEFISGMSDGAQSDSELDQTTAFAISGRMFLSLRGGTSRSGFSHRTFSA